MCLQFFFKTNLYKEFVALISKEKQVDMNANMVTLIFFKLYNMYIKKTRTMLFPYFSLTSLNKDTSVLLKVINI